MQRRIHRDDVAIIRLEMLYPLPFNRLREAFAVYPNATEIRFCQDEPANQGPWTFVNEHLPNFIPDLLPLKRVSRRGPGIDGNRVVEGACRGAGGLAG